jgi:DNA helicase-2/ATP-dependent DNA helicase PcrA
MGSKEPGKILELIKQLKRDGLTKADGLSEKLENAQAVNEEYSSWLHQNNCMDYEDLITGAIELLCCEEACLRRARSRFHHILVDEFQDTDRAQYMMIRLLGCDDSQLSNVVNACYSAYATTTKSKRASVSPAESSPPSRTVCIVGDANQAIYSWRGADAKVELRERAHINPLIEIVR